MKGVRTLDERTLAILGGHVPFLAAGMPIREAHDRSLWYEAHILRRLQPIDWEATGIAPAPRHEGRGAA